jgi:DNA-binding transcriptional ArsR family regulator
MGRQRADSDVFLAVADPTRRRLLDLLAAGEKGVTELAEPFDVTLPAISQHLRILREAKLVRERREGRRRLYRIDPAPLREVFDWIGHYERFWREKLDALGNYLERNP